MDSDWPSPTESSNSTTVSSMLKAKPAGAPRLQLSFRLHLEQTMPHHNPRILIVDDEINICRSCTKVLTKLNYEVDYALNGYDARK